MTTGQVAAASLLIALTSVACGSGTPAEPVDLVAPKAWEANRLDVDPQADHAPATVECAPGTYHVDGVAPYEGFEVTTGDCNFMAASQPTMAAVEEGDTLSIVVWHLDLDATLPGPAHVAVSIDGAILWETTVDVPAPAQLYEPRVTAPRAFAAGRAAVFHVHNHGTNEWNMQSIRIEPD